MKKYIHLLLILLSSIILLILFPTHKVNAFQKMDTFYDYESIVTIKADNGAQLLNTNIGNKKVLRDLPINSQWKIWGYSRRTDGFYYWLGGNQWIKANQGIIPVGDEWDAILSVVGKYGNIDAIPDGNTRSFTAWYYNGNNYYWGKEFWDVALKKIIPEFVRLDDYLVYPNGAVFDSKDLPHDIEYVYNR